MRALQFKQDNDIEIMDEVLVYAGPGAIVTMMVIHLIVGYHRKEYFKLEDLIFTNILSEYKKITIEKLGKVGWLFYIFWLLVFLAFLHIIT